MPVKTNWKAAWVELEEKVNQIQEGLPKSRSSKERVMLENIIAAMEEVKKHNSKKYTIHKPKKRKTLTEKLADFLCI